MSNQELLMQKLNQIGSNVVDVTELQTKVTALEAEADSHVKTNVEIKNLDFNSAPLGWVQTYYVYMKDMDGKHTPVGSVDTTDLSTGKQYIVQTIGINNNKKIQIAYEVYSNNDAMYQRTCADGKWSAWYCQIGTDYRSSPSGNP